MASIETNDQVSPIANPKRVVRKAKGKNQQAEGECVSFHLMGILLSNKTKAI